MPYAACMNTTIPPQNNHLINKNTLQVVTPFINAFLSLSQRLNRNIFHYSTLIFFLGLPFLLIPLNPGNEGTVPHVRAFASQPSKISPDSANFSPVPKKHDDDTLAALTIYFEAEGESFAGKLAVAAVIRNRMAHHFHSDGTMRGTVLRPKQFEPWITRNPDHIPFNPLNTKMQESLLAWKLVQDGRKIVNGAVLFYNPDIVKSPRWALVHRKVAKIGSHEFFHTERI